MQGLTLRFQARGPKKGLLIRPLKKKLFVSCNGQEKNGVGTSVKKNFCIIFGSKMCFMHVLS